MPKRKENKLVNRQKQLHNVYDQTHLEARSMGESITSPKSVFIEENSNVNNYVIKDLLKTFYFILFTIIVVFVASVLFTDYSFAEKARDVLNINEITF